jgi:hypothetical protein
MSDSLGGVTTRQRVLRAPYVIIRSAHILWLMAVIPLAVVSLSQQLHYLGGFLLGVLFFSGLVWSMMFMFFDLLTYPTSTLGALGASSTVFANCYFAWQGSGGDWSYAAYMTFLAFLAAFAVAFVFLMGWASYVGLRDLAQSYRATTQSSIGAKLRGMLSKKQDAHPGFWIVLGLFYGGLTVSSLGFAIVFALPFVDRLLAMPSLTWRIAALAAFVTQAAWDLTPFYRFSIFGAEASARPDMDLEKQPWFTLQMLAMVFSVVILLFTIAGVHDAPGGDMDRYTETQGSEDYE